MDEYKELNPLFLLYLHMHYSILYVLVAIAGALGVIARVTVNFWKTEWQGIILSTLVINAIGSFLIGLFFRLWKNGIIVESTYIIITGGFLGGLTTFSGYALNLVLMTNIYNSQNVRLIYFFLYALLMPFIGFIMTILGMKVIK